MKNQECSRLRKEYNAKVKTFNEFIHIVRRNKFEMSYLWKWKNDYPADWKRKAETLTADRQTMKQLRQEIKELKEQIRKCNADYAKVCEQEQA
jgi:hypothetical protein